MGKHRPKDLCWCGSGKEYKKCHRNREYETPPPIYNLHHELKIASKQRTCRAIWDKGRCSTKIVDSHSISRMTYLEKISENGHVFTLFHDLKLMGQGFSFEESAKFQKIGTRKASVFQSFCSVHDAELFSILDKGSYFDEKFFLQLIYRAACVELQKKGCCIEIDAISKTV